MDDSYRDEKKALRHVLRGIKGLCLLTQGQKKSRSPQKQLKTKRVLQKIKSLKPLSSLFIGVPTKKRKDTVTDDPDLADIDSICKAFKREQITLATGGSHHLSYKSLKLMLSKIMQILHALGLSFSACDFLELGCGAGYIVNLLVQFGARLVVGTEINSLVYEVNIPYQHFRKFGRSVFILEDVKNTTGDNFCSYKKPNTVEIQQYHVVTALIGMIDVVMILLSKFKSNTFTKVIVLLLPTYKSERAFVEEYIKDDFPSSSFQKLLVFPVELAGSHERRYLGVLSRL